MRRLAENLKESNHREYQLREEVANFVASKIIQQAKADAGGDKRLLAALIREDDSTNDIEFLHLVQNKVNCLLAEAGEEQSYAFAVGQVGKVPVAPDGYLLVFANDDTVVTKIANDIRSGETEFTRRLKGGGKGRWQGKVVEGRLRKDKDDLELMQMLQRAIRT